MSMNEENPYAAPTGEPDLERRAIGVKGGRREDLRSIAIYQKGILICILVYLLLILTRVFIPPELLIVLALVLLADVVTGTVFVFLLAIRVYSLGVGILLGILTLVPCLGLVSLLIVNGKANEVLRANGLKVGLLGVNLSDI